MSTTFSQYVSRHGDLTSAIDNAVQSNFEKTRGWNRYYKDNKSFLDGTDKTNPGVWPSIGQDEQNTLLNFIKTGISTTTVTIEEGGITINYPVEYVDETTDAGKWLVGTVYDLDGGLDSLKNWSTLNGSKKDDLIEHAAKRRMAFDWHHGIGNAFQGGAIGGESGKTRGLPTYSIIDHSPIEGVPVRNEIVLNSEGNGYFNQFHQDEAYDTWGKSHWNNSGKNESRALPGSKFKIENGKITYDKQFVGTGLQANYDAIANSFNESQGNNYKSLIEGAIDALPSAYKEDIIRADDQGNREGDINIFDAYYLDNKITRKTAEDYVQPPSFYIDGKGFDSDYYGNETTYGQAALKKWSDAQTGVTVGGDLGSIPDLDVVGPYGITNTEDNRNLFLHGTYTDIKNSGIADKDNRGNAAEATEAARDYLETWDSMDPGSQTVYRDNLLGLTTSSSGSGSPTIDWDEPFVLDSNGNIMYEEDEYGNRTPIVNKEGVSFLETSIFNIFGKKDLEEQDKFQALALDVLKTTVEKLDQEKKRENELNIYRGLPGFNEIYGANSSIANSLIGDSGIGGYLSMAGVNVDSMTESLEKDLSNVTGISNNSSVFNWQKWFDETLLDRYENMEEITGKLKADIEDLDPILNENQWTRFQNQINNREPGTDRWNQLMDANNLPRGVSKERALEIKSPDTWGALLNKYDLDSSLNKEEALEILTGAENEIFKIYTIEDQFRESFIEDYIKPRFDQSKSMDEFISYLDSLDEDEQNIFQTQDAMEALKTTASAYASAKLEQIQNTSPQYFDAAFYFDPTTAIDPRFEGQKDEDYRRQADRVQADYDAANANANSIIEGTIDGNPNGYTWADYAYYYGIDLKDKAQFARLHFDVLGNGKVKDEQGNPVFYDPAKDVTSAADIQGYIADTVIPAVNQTKIDLDGAVFSEFTTPEEFADHLLKGIDPTENNPEWQEVLEQFGMEVDASLEEVRDYILDITRTGAATEIRETIKFFNEKKLTPTQERIGVSYIEREEDDNPTDPEGQTALYQIFSDAGYAGSQDEFFAEFMPDADRGDMALITQAMPGGAGFNLDSISSDPFTALSQVGGLMGSSESVFDTGGYEDDDEEESNYFTLFDEPEDSYSDAGRDYISEYTSFFSS